MFERREMHHSWEIVRGGEEGASPIMLMLDAGSQCSVKWGSEAVVCGPGSRVPVYLRTPAEPTQSQSTNGVYLQMAGRTHTIQQSSHGKFIGKEKRAEKGTEKGTDRVQRGEQRFVPGHKSDRRERGDRQGAPFKRELSKYAQETRSALVSCS